MITADVNDVATEAPTQPIHIVTANSRTQTLTKSLTPTPKGIPISVQRLLKRSAIPRPTHLDPRSTRIHRSPKTQASADATSAINLATSQMRVQAKARLKPALRIRYLKTKVSWPYGKVHLPTKNNKNVLRVSSNPGETTCAPHVWASFRSITDVIPTI